MNNAEDIRLHPADENESAQTDTCSAVAEIRQRSCNIPPPPSPPPPPPLPLVDAVGDVSFIRDVNSPLAFCSSSFNVPMDDVTLRL